MDYNNLIKNILKKQNIEYTEEIKNKLDIYYNYLVEYNNNVNLTAITDKEEVYIKHFADSMLGAMFLKNNATVCDIGTGAGFPGVVLKIIRPDIQLTLVDSLNKRVEFLKSLLKKLDINDVIVLHNRAEDVDFKNKYLNGFNYVVARAVAKLNTLTEYCLPFVKTNGQFIAYKSIEAKNEAIEAKKAIEILGGSLCNINNIELYNDIERNFIIINKIKPTTNKYPRGQNKPRIKPL